MNKNMVECPDCHRRFNVRPQKNAQQLDQIAANVKASSIATLKLAAHFGTRAFVQTLSLPGGPNVSKMAGRAAGMALSQVIGRPQDVHFTEKLPITCPYCGKKWIPET